MPATSTLDPDTDPPVPGVDDQSSPLNTSQQVPSSTSPLPSPQVSTHNSSSRGQQEADSNPDSASEAKTEGLNANSPQPDPSHHSSPISPSSAPMPSNTTLDSPPHPSLSSPTPSTKSHSETQDSSSPGQRKSSSEMATGSWSQALNQHSPIGPVAIDGSELSGSVSGDDLDSQQHFSGSSPDAYENDLVLEVAQAAARSESKAIEKLSTPYNEAPYSPMATPLTSPRDELVGNELGQGVSGSTSSSSGDDSLESMFPPAYGTDDSVSRSRARSLSESLSGPYSAPPSPQVSPTLSRRRVRLPSITTPINIPSPLSKVRTPGPLSAISESSVGSDDSAHPTNRAPMHTRSYSAARSLLRVVTNARAQAASGAQSGGYSPINGSVGPVSTPGGRSDLGSGVEGDLDSDDDEIHGHSAHHGYHGDANASNINHSIDASNEAFATPKSYAPLDSATTAKDWLGAPKTTSNAAMNAISPSSTFTSRPAIRSSVLSPDADSDRTRLEEMRSYLSDPSVNSTHTFAYLGATSRPGQAGGPDLSVGSRIPTAKYPPTELPPDVLGSKNLGDVSSTGTRAPMRPPPLKTPAVTEESRADTGSFSLTDYLSGELYRGSFTAEEAALHYARMRRLHNFLVVPARLERLLLFSWFICLDSYLFNWTFLPIRALSGILSWIKSQVWELFPTLARSSTRPEPPRITATEVCDVIRMALAVLCCLSLQTLDSSVLYHYVRGQTPIKLYVIFNVLEIFDKLCSSFGQDILDSVFVSAVSAVVGIGRRRNPGSPVTPQPTTPVRSGWYYGAAFLFHATIAIVYVHVHAFVLFTHVVTLNVAVNSTSNALLVLLISNQFVELKGSVFKKFEPQNLFQVSCSDIVERFQMTFYLLIIVMNNMQDLTWNWSDPFFQVLVGQIGFVCLSEVVIDWVKHAFITKFNRIDPDVYDKFYVILAGDMAGARTHTNFLDPAHFVSRRIGFSTLPLFCISIRAIVQHLHANTVTLVLGVLVWGILCGLKTLISIHLLAHSLKTRSKHAKRLDLDSSQAPHRSQNLGDTLRWEMYKSRIP